MLQLASRPEAGRARGFFDPVSGELRSPGKLKHAPPMRRSRLEMAKLQIRAKLGPISLRAMPSIWGRLATAADPP